MDLGLDITRVRGRGRAAKAVVAEVVRPLVEADIALLSTERAVQPIPLKAIRARHHLLARLLAEGTAPGEAALIANYAPSRVSILQSDPTFRELVEFYRADVDRQYLGLHERLAALGADAADELSRRLEDAPEELSDGLLLEITKVTADRTGHGPQSSAVNVNVNVDMASRLRAARERAAEARRAMAGPVIDLKPEVA